jgi:hypothetical protein
VIHPLSVRVLLATAWFAFCGCYSIFSGFKNHSWVWCVSGLATFLGAVGILPRWPWAKWLVYVVSFVIVSTWIYGLIWALRAGTFPYETVELTALGLVPGFVLLAATIWSTDIVRRRYNLPSTPNQRLERP